MMLFDLLPAALGIAANPPALVAVIVLLSAEDSRRNAVGFVLGWIAGLVAVGGALLLAGDAAAALGDPSAAVLVVKLALGVALIVLAGVQWAKDRRSEGPKEMPGWMTSLMGMRFPRVVMAAALFAGLNPKTLAFNLAAVLTIADAGMTAVAQAIVLGAFVLLSSLPLCLPVLYSIVARDSAEVLGRLQLWLVDNSATVTALVLLILGLVMAASSGKALLALL